MPEKKNKKQKAEQKATASSEPLKPLSHYVSDRLELTKQLFSCLKNKQIKERLPPNLQNKSIERIQQICLDEILGISTKRLISVINNTRCPENTDSDDDSEIEQLDEHISLEEISSDSDEDVQQKAKEAVKKTDKAPKVAKNQSKTPKEMTMLELLELQARARAIRSQLALEPVTKIELDSDDDDDDNEGKGKVKNGEGRGKETPTSSNDGNKNKGQQAAEKSKSAEKTVIDDRLVKRVVPPPPPKPAPILSARPVKLKRNYKSQTSDCASTSSAITQKDPTPSKTVDSEKNEDKTAHDDDRCSSPDVVNMDPSPETFFISDSEEDDEPSPKKSSTLNKMDETTTEEDAMSKEQKIIVEVPQEPEDREVSATNSRVYSPDIDKPESSKSSQAPDQSNDDAMNDDDVVHLMSDTEIDLHHHSDKEDEEIDVPVKKTEEQQEAIIDTPKQLPVVHQSNQSDDDVVEINNSSDDEMMNEGDKSGESSMNTQTWENRWLNSSKTQSILKTTQLASKVRGNILKTKKSLLANEKKKSENEKVMKEKVLSLEEGSMEQFKVIKDNNDPSAN